MSDASPQPAASRPLRLSTAKKALALAAAFTGASALAAIALPYAPSLNLGLLNAFEIVAKNLLGDAIFEVTPQPNAQPQEPCRIDIAGDSLLPLAVTVTLPQDPCAPAVRMLTTRNLEGGAPRLTMLYDPNKVIPTPAVFDKGTNLPRCVAGAAPLVADAVPATRTIDAGLVRALDAVGKNLWGSAVFAATAPATTYPTDPMRLDIAGDTLLPLGVTVTLPQDPCRIAAQAVVSIPAPGHQLLTVSYDASVVTPVASAISSQRINVARCLAAR